MRIERLDLLRFGRFSGTSLEMPPGAPDLHIVAGRNEAGKTTTMAAIEDFLFGIPARTSYAFLHDYTDMRVGAVMAAGEERFELLRRKGNQDTLLDSQGVPLPAAEAMLTRLLGGIERAGFRRMFNLSHGRLAEGGREILAAEGEVGEALFSAVSGLRGLRERRKALDDEASNIFQKRKAATRVFYRATDRLAAAERTLKETIRRPEQWKNLKKQFDVAEASKQRLDAEYRNIAAESRRVSRIRRVLPVVRQKISLDEAIAALGEVVPLPPEADAQARKATEGASAAATSIQVHEQDLAEKRAERDAILVDAEAHTRRAAIQEIEDQRVKVLQMHKDLPKRQGELEAALDQIRRAAADLGLDFADNRSLLDHIPSPRAVGHLTEVLQRRGGLEEALAAREDALRTADRRLEEQRSRVGGASQGGDAGRLAAVLAANRDKADLGAKIRDKQRDLDEIRERIGVLRGSLRPSLPDDIDSETDLRALPAPRGEVIRQFDERIHDLEAGLEDVRRNLAAQRRQLRSDQAKRRRGASEASGITQSALEKVRSERDELWSLVHRRYVRQDPVPDAPADLAARLEAATKEADAVADRRFERAEAAGRLAELDEAIREREAQMEEMAAVEAGLAADRERLLAEWRLLWEGCPFEPGLPADMLDWRKTRDALADAAQALRREERALAGLREEEASSRAELSAILAGFGLPAEGLEADSLSVLMKQAEDMERKQQEASRRESEVHAALLKATEECDLATQKLRQAEAAWAGWEEEWKRALEQVGLDPESSGSGTVEAELLGEIRDAAGRAQDLQSKRIDPMHRDIDAFKARVSGLVSEIAPELSGMPPEEAALRLSGRLEADLDHRKHREDLEREIAAIEGKIRDRRRARAESEGLLEPLFRAAGVPDLPALNAAIVRSDRYRELTLERDRALRRLDEQGDGFAFAELAAECENTNPDDARAQEGAAESRRLELQQEQNQAVEQVVNIKKELEAFQDDAVAARLGAERQEALAAVRDAAERYARVRTAEMLLRWALERFRKEKQGPMLRRAGELFRTLTSDSFTSLQVDFDSKDRMRLDAVRDDGSVVQVGGLSSGSEDQLYLALRVAAVEDYVGRAPALPFIADDLFVNFDENRAAAGFRILGELALRTQVLFFTHHEHLVEIARGVLGASVPVIRLEDA